MSWFRKRKSARQLGEEVVAAVAELVDGKIDREQYVQQLAAALAELKVGMDRTMRFSLDELEEFADCAEQLDPLDRLGFYADIMPIIAMPPTSPRSDYLLVLLSIPLSHLAVTKAFELMNEGTWDEALAYCDLATKAIPHVAPTGPSLIPDIHRARALALRGLRRYSEAYQDFKRAEEAIQNALASSYTSDEERNSLGVLLDDCRRYAQELVPHAR